MIMMKIVLFLLSLLETGLGQTGERRVCGLQMVVDNLVWTNTRLRVVARHNLTGHSHQEISRLTRFEIKSLLSRLVNRANTVLLSQQFNNIHYRLAVQDIQVDHITSHLELKTNRRLSRFWRLSPAPSRGNICVRGRPVWRVSWSSFPH